MAELTLASGVTTTGPVILSTGNVSTLLGEGISSEREQYINETAKTVDDAIKKLTEKFESSDGHSEQEDHNKSGKQLFGKETHDSAGHGHGNGGEASGKTPSSDLHHGDSAHLREEQHEHGDAMDHNEQEGGHGQDHSQEGGHGDADGHGSGGHGDAGGHDSGGHGDAGGHGSGGHGDAGGHGSGGHGGGGGHHEEEPSVTLAAWKWHHVENFFIVVLFIVGSAVVKLLHHKMHWLAEKVPESCVLIWIGVGFGAIMNAIDTCEKEVCNGEEGSTLGRFPEFNSTLFFYILLPPIILEAAFSLHNRVFMGNLRTILLYAIFGTVMNFLIIGALMILFHNVGAMGSDEVYIRTMKNGEWIEYVVDGEDSPKNHLTDIQILLWAALISAVDPVAVLAIFSEVGVNADLYFNVFGESLLNDGVAVVLYNVLIGMAGKESIGVELTDENIAVGFFSFFTIAFGGLLIGLCYGLFSALATKACKGVESLEILSVITIAYIAYLSADCVGWSGIISLIGCGLLQAHWSFKNISEKSLTTITYIMNLASSTSDCLIFIYLGMQVMAAHTWHTGFTLWALALCFIVRFAVTFFLTIIVNLLRKGIKPINIQEQVIMSYGGLRGGVGYSLVKMIPLSQIPGAPLFVTTTLAVVMCTALVQGSTMKSLVTLLHITLASNDDETLNEEIHMKVIDHVMGGVEIIMGQIGHNFLEEWLHHMDNKYWKKWFCVSYDRKMKRMYEEFILADHLTHLYGPTLIISDDLEFNGTWSRAVSYDNNGYANEADAYPLGSLKSRGSVISNSTLTIKDRNDLSNALRINPVNKFQLTRDRDITRDEELCIHRVLEKRRQTAGNIRDTLAMKNKLKEIRRESNVSAMSTEEMMKRDNGVNGSFNDGRIQKITKVLEANLGERHASISLVMSEHQEYRRRKSLVPGSSGRATPERGASRLNSLSSHMRPSQAHRMSGPPTRVTPEPERGAHRLNSFPENDVPRIQISNPEDREKQYRKDRHKSE